MRIRRLVAAIMSSTVVCSSLVFYADTQHAGASGPTYGAQVSVANLGIDIPEALAIDGSGDVYVASPDNNVLEVPRSGSGWGSQAAVPFTGLNESQAILSNAAGDLFVESANGNSVQELPRSGGEWGTQETVPFTGLATPVGLADDAEGDLFVSNDGGDTVVELSSTTGGGWGAQTTLPFTGIKAPGPLAVDAVGDVFLSDYQNSRVVELPKNGTGWGPQVTLPFGGLSNPQGLAFDSSGNLYVVSEGNQEVFELPKNGTGWGAQVTVECCGLSNPDGLVIDASGNLYIASSATDQVFELPKNGTRWGSLSALPLNPIGDPQGGSVDAAGNVFVSDYQSGFIYEISPSLNGYGTPAQLPFNGRITDPYTASVDPEGDLFVLAFQHVYELPKSGSGWGAQVTLPFTGISIPSQAAFDSSGDLFVIDSTNNRIVELPKSGSGWGAQVVIPLTGASDPAGLAMDASGNLFVADTGNNRILELPKSGSGWGAQMVIGVGNTEDPEAISVDASDNLFTNDEVHSDVVEIPKTLGGWGSPVTVPFTGVTKQVNSDPRVAWMTLDPEGDVYAFGDFIHIQASIVELPIEPNSTTTAVSTNPNPSTPGQNVSATANVTGSDGGGTVSFTVNGNPVSGCSATTLQATGSSFMATCVVPSLPTGSTTIAASYSGDSSSLASSGSVTQVVIPSTVVTNCNDSGLGSLRQAVANVSPGNNAVTFALSPPCSTITLTSGAISLISSMTIAGPGASNVAVSGNNAGGIFVVPSGVTATISGLSMEDGRVTNGYGAGINNAGTLSVSSDTFTDNLAVDGGSDIYNDAASLTVSNSSFDDSFGFGSSYPTNGGAIDSPDGNLVVSNSSFDSDEAEDGGAISAVIVNNQSASLQVTGSTFTNNYANIYGGAIFCQLHTCNISTSTFTNNTGEGWGGAIANNGATVTVDQSTFTDNASNAGGGAIANFGETTTDNSTFTGNYSVDGGAVYEGSVSDSTLTGNTAHYGGAVWEASVSDSTISNNTSYEDGGGVYSSSVSGSTVSGNTADGDGGGAYGGSVQTSTIYDNTAQGQGGGIYAPAGVGLLHVTVASNVAPAGEGAGLYYTSGFVQVRDSIIADNGSGLDCAGTASVVVTDLGSNLDDDGSCGLSASSLSDVPALLDPAGLANNGGPTPTVALQSDSPAIGLVSAGAYCTGLGADQTGTPWPTPCNAGAVEAEVAAAQVPTSTTLTASANPATYGSTVTFTAAVNAVAGNGTVSFYADGSDAAPDGCTSVTLSPSGSSYTATCTTSSLLAGTHQIDAQYSGDSADLSSSASLIETVGPAPLTITALSPTITYGQSVPSISASYAGFVDGDGPSSLRTGPTCVAAETQSSTPDAGAYPTLCSGASDPNYNISYVGGVLTVGQATLTVTPNDVTVPYGQTPVFTASYSGFELGDTPGSLTTEPDCGVNGSDITVGTYTIACSGGSDPNYAIDTSATGTLTVTQAPTNLTWADPASITYGTALSSTQLDATASVPGTFTYTPAPDTVLAAGTHTLSVTFTPNDAVDYQASSGDVTITVDTAPLVVTASNASSVYGTVPPAITASYLGFVNGDSAASLTALPSCSTAATSSSGVGEYETTCGGAADPNYSIAYGNGIETVIPATLTVTADPATKVYGQPSPAFAYTINGFVNGDSLSDVSGNPTLSSPATTASGVGDYPIDVDVSGMSAANYTFVGQSGTLTVTPATLTVAADAKTMVYGSPVPALSATVLGFVNGDDAGVISGSPVLTTTATSSSGVGTYPITVDVSGLSAANYTFVGESGTLSVTPATLTVAADPATKVYGNADPALTASVSGFENADTVSVISGSPILSTSAGTGSGVGSYEITVDVSGLSAANYTFVGQSGTLTVTPATLTVTATSATKVYGEANPTFGSTISGFVNGDEAGVVSGTPGLSTIASSASGVGTYPITVDVSGLSAANYTFVGQSGTLTVTPAALTVTADSKSKTYGAPNPTLADTITGFVNGDTSSVITGQPVLSTLATQGTGVGSYEISVDVSDMSAANYTFVAQPGTLTIGAGLLTVIADAKSDTYGQPDPALTYTVVGFQNGDTSSVVSGTPTLTTTATSASGVGSYPITVDVSAMSSANYTFVGQSGTLTVTPATLTVAANPATKVYGSANPALGYTISGFENGDTTSVVSGMPGLSTTATSSSGVGSYPITVNGTALSAANYTFVGESGTLSVTPAVLTVAANPQSKSYGEANPALTFTVTGFENGDASSVVSGTPVLSTTATTSSAVGSYPITVNVNGLSATNYTFSAVNGTLTVTPAVLLVSANPQVMTYGQHVPALTYSISGFVNGDTSSVVTGAPVLTTTAIANSTTLSDAGTYPIDVSLGTLSAPNYTFLASNGTLTISPASTTTTAGVSGGGLDQLTADLTFQKFGVTTPVPGQAITFAVGGSTLGTGATNSSGLAVYQPSLLQLLGVLAGLNLGLVTYTATFAGATDFKGSSGTGQ